LKRLDIAITYESAKPFTFFISKEDIKDLDCFEEGENLSAPRKVVLKRVGVRNNQTLQGRFVATYEYQREGIEASKKFKKGLIKRLATPAERREAKRQAEISEKIKNLKGMPIEYESMRKPELIEFGVSIGITDKTLNKEELINSIKEILG
jgi:hypothetical protein